MSKFINGTKVKILNGPHKDEIGFIESVEIKNWDDAEPETIYEVKFEDVSYPFGMFEDQLEEIEISLFEKVISDNVYISETKEDRYPKIGPFYFYKNSIIMSDEYRRRVNPVTLVVESVIHNIFGSPKEHRDMWDNYMLVHYPELKETHDDDHKALPRGRVDYSCKSNQLSFFVTLDKCIKRQEGEIKRIFCLGSYPVVFMYDAMNYQCKNCRRK